MNENKHFLQHSKGSFSPMCKVFGIVGENVRPTLGCVKVNGPLQIFAVGSNFRSSSF